MQDQNELLQQFLNVVNFYYKTSPYALSNLRTLYDFVVHKQYYYMYDVYAQ